MRRLHGKSIVLGIGIGMIITSIAGMIYYGGTKKELTKEEIISMAKGYGLVEPVKFLNKNDKSNSNTDTEKAASNSTDTKENTQNSNNSNNNTNNTSNTDTVNKSNNESGNASNNTKEENKNEGTNTTNKQQAESTEEKRNISIVVQSGYGAKEVAKELLDKGVITNAKDFYAALISKKATHKIRTGTYLFKKNDDLEYIVKTICKFK